ncbi:MAG TPA: BatA domain-containing protein [Vicinamibacterales bacterium]|jgi:hypothetical protein
MTWQAPGAFVALLLVGGPILVHFLMRRHATRIIFPAMRFVPSVHATAVRLRRPSDPGLMLLRSAAVAAAALAAAQPVLVTAARQRAWASRTTRALIVDTSASVPPAIARPIADREAHGAVSLLRLESADLHDAIRRAVPWLQNASAGRPEIVIVSDFQIGAIDAGDLSVVPPGVGIRLLRAGRPSSAGAPLPAVDGWRGSRWSPSLTLDGNATLVTWTRTGAAGRGPLQVLAAPADAAAARRALDAARASGVVSANPARPVEIAFAGAGSARDALPSTPWIVSAATRLASDPRWIGEATSLTIGERDGVLTAHTAMSAASPVGPAIVRAVVEAAQPVFVDREQELAAIDDVTLAAWQRVSVPHGVATPPEADDGRWLWLIALALLVGEAVVRRRGAEAMREAHADAA